MMNCIENDVALSLEYDTPSRIEYVCGGKKVVLERGYIDVRDGTASVIYKIGEE